jgi:hypothetical protein
VPLDVEKRWDIATVSSRIFKASALAAAVTTIGVGALSIGNPVALVPNMADWWNDKPASAARSRYVGIDHADDGRCAGRDGPAGA